MKKKLKWKEKKNGDLELFCDCYDASVYQINSRWGAEIGGPGGNDNKVYKPIYIARETAQDLVLSYIREDIGFRISELIEVDGKIKDLY